MALKQLSGCAIIERNRLLLLKKIEHSHYEFPGGGIEPGETPEQAAIREAKEELGCDVELLGYYGTIKFTAKGRAFISHLFYAKPKKGQTPFIAEKDVFSALAWVPLPAPKDYSLAPNVAKFITGYSKTRKNR
jgi:8-oxo-dGTP diphosphatase